MSQQKEFPELTPEARAAFLAGCAAAQFPAGWISRPDRRYLAAFLNEAMKRAREAHNHSAVCLWDALIRRLEEENRRLSQELGDSAVELRQEAEYLRGDLATAREAVRRLVRWNLAAYDSEVTWGVYLWATANHMAGPLPPLPERLAKREQLQGDPEARC
jgi:hypothetical protein